MNQNISHKAKTVLLIIMIFGLVTSSTLFALQKIRLDHSQTIQNALTTVLYAVQKTQNLLIKQRNLTIETFVNSNSIIEITEQLLQLHQQKKPLLNTAELQNIRTKVTPMLKRFEDLGFFIIAPDRNNIASMRDENMGEINLIHQQKQTLLNKAFSGKSTFIPTIKSDVQLKTNIKKGATMFLTTPIRSKKGDVIAVFALRIDPIKHFNNITKLGRIGASGETYAFDSLGYFLTTSRFKHQLVKTKQLKGNQTEVLTLRVSDPGGNLLTGFSPSVKPRYFPLTVMAKSASLGFSGVNLKGYRDYRGVNVVGAWLWSEEYDYGLATEVDLAEAFQPYFQSRNTVLAVIAFTLLICITLLRIVITTQERSKKDILAAHHILESKVEERTKELLTTKNELSQAVIGLKKLSITDPLTLLANRRYFDKKIKTEWQRCLREQKPLSIIFLDIDYFKLFNDSYGHLLGDECLQEISNMLMSLTINNRPGDLICRYGGEEFIILLSGADTKHTREVAELVRSSIEKLNIPHNKTQVARKYSVTVSIGCETAYDLTQSTIKDIIQHADDALYKAKNLGRNNVVHYQQKIKETNNSA